MNPARYHDRTFADLAIKTLLDDQALGCQCLFHVNWMPVRDFINSSALVAQSDSSKRGTDDVLGAYPPIDL